MSANQERLGGVRGAQFLSQLELGESSCMADLLPGPSRSPTSLVCKMGLQPTRFGALTRGVWPFLPNPLRTRPPASPGEDAAAQRQAQEGDVQGQEGAETGHAGGPAADHHGGAAHIGRGRAPDRGVRVCGHAPHHHRVSVGSRGPGGGKQKRNGFHIQRFS
ncbi:single-pass membrane and coiled-coil domain-containing protein 4 [Ailuropoda melanoleuca]|uniref:single-pass membrane and coiled-coil domain-containing protein 4 n=1 Tax=Ailuropoda melanoleuca TaxID=9646 RepID=UPI001494EE45|nr:single-pass membrane and coiled-coil domain-containing protein 4 [Ailuropoda melanoleuca]